MNNAEKNTYVKEQLTAALLALLAERELKDISVQQLTDRARVSRVSFYRNFTDKEDVLRARVNVLFQNWWDGYVGSGTFSQEELFGSLFAHLTAEKDFYSLLSRRGLLRLVKDVIYAMCGPKPEMTNVQAYGAGFVAGGICGWVEEWFARGMQESGEEMARLMAQQQGGGVLSRGNDTIAQ